MTKNKLHFGPGGVPLSCRDRSTQSGIKRVSELGLDLMEMEFVHGVKMSPKTAEEVGRLARENAVTLTIHAPYYINLNANEPEKRAASRERILQSCRIAHKAGVASVCFHAAFMLGQEMDQVFDSVLGEMIKIEEQLNQENIDDVWLAPEVMGKETQFAGVDELLLMAKNLKRTRICIDFAHLFARSVGKINGFKMFKEILTKVKNELGDEASQKLHMHLSGIEYSAKGERKHLVLRETHLDWQGVLRAIKETGIGGYLVCESPNLEEDAQVMRDYYHSIK